MACLVAHFFCFLLRRGHRTAQKGETTTINSKLRLYSSTRRINGFDFQVQNTHEEGDRVTVTVPLGVQLSDIIHTLRFISHLSESDFPREARRLKQRAAAFDALRWMRN